MSVSGRFRTTLVTSSDMALIPDNLVTLHQHEEAVRVEALGAITGDAHLSIQLQAVHDVIDHLTLLARLDSVPGTDRHTLQLVGIRAVNFLASALKAGLSGYFQVAFSLLRDLLETANLIDLFLTDTSLVAVWKTADKKTHNRLFKPVLVRQALEKHPQYVGQNRQPKYQLLSNYASHPTYTGFALLSGDGSPKIGPFFDVKLLRALLEDMGQLGAHAALNLSMAIQTDEVGALRAKSVFVEKLGKYWSTWK